jgi:hypothetical protein
MKPWRFFGPDAVLLPVARMVMEEDVAGLAAGLGRDWQLDEPIPFTPNTSGLAISLALVENRLRVLDFLLSRKANLNVRGAPAITYAVSNCAPATIDRILAAGARITATNRVKSNAYSTALYAERIELLPFLAQRGLPVDHDRGVSLRQAAFQRQIEGVRFFLERGLNPNLRAPNMVFPANPTALQVAAGVGDLEIVRLLLQHGADPTLTDRHGLRPYLEARMEGHAAVADHLRGREPAEWHSTAGRIALFESYGAPAALIAFLRGADRRIMIGRPQCAWIELLPLLDTYERAWRGDRLLMLHATCDDRCATGELAWSRRRQALLTVDVEHGWTTRMGSWEGFLADPGKAMARQWRR